MTFNFGTIFQSIVPTKLSRLLLNRDFGLKRAFLVADSVKTRAQVTHESKFSSEIGAANVCRLLVNRDCGLENAFPGAD